MWQIPQSTVTKEYIVQRMREKMNETSGLREYKDQDEGKKI